MRIQSKTQDGTAKRLREGSGLTLQEGARRLRVDPATLWRWETGKSLPMGRNLVLYGRFLSKCEAAA